MIQIEHDRVYVIGAAGYWLHKWRAGVSGRRYDAQAAREKLRRLQLKRFVTRLSAKYDRAEIEKAFKFFESPGTIN